MDFLTVHINDLIRIANWTSTKLVSAEPDWCVKEHVVRVVRRILIGTVALCMSPINSHGEHKTASPPTLIFSPRLHSLNLSRTLLLRFSPLNFVYAFRPVALQTPVQHTDQP
jgi:hypothetical protein